MARTITPKFAASQQEGQIVGRLLAGYSELEFELCSCLGAVMGNLDTAVRLFYRVRGEEARLLAADAIMRNRFDAFGLINMYRNALADMRFCREIRNQFAHCHWYGAVPGHGLAMIDLERVAKSNNRSLLAKPYYIDVHLLTNHEVYFIYVHDCLFYLEAEYLKLAGVSSSHSVPLPTKIPRPPKYNGSP